ncbi:hypothetical protein JCM11251_004349 [Rhodosporidiobolus azoricus]
MAPFVMVLSSSSPSSSPAPSESLPAPVPAYEQPSMDDDKHPHPHALARAGHPDTEAGTSTENADLASLPRSNPTLPHSRFSAIASAPNAPLPPYAFEPVTSKLKPVQNHQLTSAAVPISSRFGMHRHPTTIDQARFAPGTLRLVKPEPDKAGQDKKGSKPRKRKSDEQAEAEDRGVGGSKKKTKTKTLPNNQSEDWRSRQQEKTKQQALAVDVGQGKGKGKGKARATEEESEEEDQLAEDED